MPRQTLNKNVGVTTYAAKKGILYVTPTLVFMNTVTKRLYRALIAPRQPDEDKKNRELVLNFLLAGTLLIVLLAFAQFVLAITIGGEQFLVPRMLIVLAFGVFIGTLMWLSRKGWHKTASLLLVLIYFCLATALVFLWSIYLPIGGLLFSLVVVLAGILLGPRYSLYAAITIVASLLLAQQAAQDGLVRPDMNWTTRMPQLDDVIGFSFIFAIIALVSWLFNRQMERSLHRAKTAEAELLKQKSLLEVTVKKRTDELQAAQLEKIREMYRFAELGQLSTAMMHDLANHLTSLTLDIEGLQGQGRSRAVSRARRSISYIDDMVVRVREQLHGKGHTRTFSVADEVDAIVNMLRHKAQIAGVSLRWQPSAGSKGLRVTGEPVRLRQLMANLISNGIDAYYEPRDDIDEQREVEVTIASDEHHIIITVNDWGRGIPKQHCDKLFEPFFSTKKTGMGMGLYIAKQVVVEHFLGDIKIASPSQPTSFVITLPKA